MHFTDLLETQKSFFFNNSAFFQFVKSLSAVDLQLSKVSCSYAGDAAHNMYSIPAVYQRIFDQVI